MNRGTFYLVHCNKIQAHICRLIIWSFPSLVASASPPHILSQSGLLLQLSGVGRRRLGLCLAAESLVWHHETNHLIKPKGLCPMTHVHSQSLWDLFLMGQIHSSACHQQLQVDLACIPGTWLGLCLWDPGVTRPGDSLGMSRAAFTTHFQPWTDKRDYIWAASVKQVKANTE